MHIHKVTVRNFRLLAKAELVLEDQTTLIVGRNNSGKTSLSEAIRRFLVDQNARFQLEDFSIASYDGFCEALKAKKAGQQDDEVRVLVPSIELRLLFRYAPQQPDLGALSDFVIDLDPECNEALAVARYEVRDGAIESLFADQPAGDLTDEDRMAFFQVLRERVPSLFAASVWAEDPNDPTNRQADVPERAPLPPEDGLRERSARPRRRHVERYRRSGQNPGGSLHRGAVADR